MNIFLARPVRWRSTSTPSGELAVMCWGLSTSVKPTARGEPTTWGEAWSAAWCEGVGSKFPETAVGLGSAGARLNRAAPSGGGAGAASSGRFSAAPWAAQRSTTSFLPPVRCAAARNFVSSFAPVWRRAGVTPSSSLHCNSCTVPYFRRPENGNIWLEAFSQYAAKTAQKAMIRRGILLLCT